MRLSERLFFYKGSPSIAEDYGGALYRGMGSSNFLVVAGDRQIMIDSGVACGPDQRRVWRELAADGVDLARTAGIYFSHGHPDHIQQAKRLCRRWGTQLFIHRDNEPFIRSEQFHFESYYNYPEPIRREIMVLPRPFARWLYRFLGFGFDYLKVDGFFDGGAIAGAGELRTVELPGHCPGHVGFHFAEERLLYGADLLFESDSRYSYLPCATNAASSLARSLADIETVEAMDVVTYVPGHGRVVNGGFAIKVMLRQAQSNALQLMEDAAAALRQRRQTLSGLTRAVFGERSKQFVFNVALTYQALKLLQERGRVQPRYHAGQCLWQAD